MKSLLRKAAIAATLLSSGLAATPASAALLANDPCSTAYVQGAIACQGYYGTNLLQGKAGDSTSSSIQAIIDKLLTAPTDKVDPAYTAGLPYKLDTSKVLATFDSPGNQIDFGKVLLSGLTVVGAHFGNNTDSDQNNVTAFWLINVTSPTSKLTLLDDSGNPTTKGTSNAQLFATGQTAAVPEPSTWALMLIGFGGMGVAMRRRRSATALPQMA